MRFVAAHQIDITSRDVVLAPGSGDDHNRQAVPFPNKSATCTALKLSVLGKTSEYACRTETIAALIEIEFDAVRRQVNDVDEAGAVDIGEPDTPLVKLIRVVEARCIVHRDFRAKTSVTQIGPIAHFRIAYAHEVSQAIATHVGEINRLGAVGEIPGVGHCSSSSA